MGRRVEGVSRPAPGRGTVGGAVLLLAVAVAGGCGSSADEPPPSAAATTAPDVSLATRVDGSGEGCLLQPEAVSAALGAAVDESGPVAGRAPEEGSDDYYVSWQGCTYRTGDGTEVAVAELVDGEEPAVGGFARLADRAAGAAPAGSGGDGDGPRLVTGIGDEAVREDDRLFLRVGDRAAVAEGETAAGRPLPPATLDALATAAAGALE